MTILRWWATRDDDGTRTLWMGVRPIKGESGDWHEAPEGIAMAIVSEEIDCDECRQFLHMFYPKGVRKGQCREAKAPNRWVLQAKEGGQC